MIYGLVSEFNPFHNGHKWLIDKVKTENDTVVTVMSSSFVQRGDISIISKMDRTFASLKMVLTLYWNYLLFTHCQVQRTLEKALLRF